MVESTGNGTAGSHVLDSKDQVTQKKTKTADMDIQDMEAHRDYSQSTTEEDAIIHDRECDDLQDALDKDECVEASSKNAELDKHLQSSNPTTPFLGVESALPSEEASSAHREPEVTMSSSSSGNSASDVNKGIPSTAIPGMSTFDEMLSAVAGNIMKDMRPEPPNFLEELVGSLGSSAAYTPGETEEVKEERKRMTDTHRMLKELTSDSDLMRQVMRAAANPEMAKELARQADTAWRNIEAVPGGFRALCQMHRNIQQPLWQAVTNGGTRMSASSSRYRNTTPPKPTERLNVEPLPNPWASPSPSYGGNNGLNPTSLRSILQTPSQPRYSGMDSFGSFLRSPVGQSKPVSSIPNPFANLMNGNIPSHNSAVVQPNVVAAAGSGMNQDTSDGTSDDKLSANEKYKNELKELEAMGMSDRDRCLTALEASDGDLFQALDLLQSLDEMDPREQEKDI